MRNLLSSLVYLVLYSTVLCSIYACKPSIPSQYLSRGEMSNILYDYHVAQAMAANSNNFNTNMVSYKVAVLKKHKCTEAKFDSSMVYYTRHTALLHDIYEGLAERLNEEAKSLGASVGDIDRFGMGSAKGDTANIWTYGRAQVLSTSPTTNVLSFNMLADSSFHAGDRLVLDFDAQFIYQDGSRDGVVALAIVFQNDSINQQILHVNNSQHYTLTIENTDSLGIKAVKGFMLLNKDNNISSAESTLKLMILTNIRLIRMHIKTESTTAVSIDENTTQHMSNNQPPVPVSSPVKEQVDAATERKP